MIDLHCHLLPAVDDGPSALEGALRLARAQVQAGVRTVAATPHVSERYPTARAAIADGVAQLRTALADAAVPLEVVAGAEVDPLQALELPDEELHGLTLGGAGWLLLEVPFTNAAPLEHIVHRLRSKGLSILLAHPERSPLVQRDPSVAARLVIAGARTQVTAASLTGRFGREARRCADALLDAGLVHIVASDAHDAQGRPPGMREPLEAIGLGGLAPLLCEANPAAVLAGESLPERVHGERPRGLRARLRMRR